MENKIEIDRLQHSIRNFLRRTDLGAGICMYHFDHRRYERPALPSIPFLFLTLK